MSITYRNGIAILQLVLYLPAFSFALWLAFRHGFRRNAGWIYLVILSLIRIVGSCAQLETISNNSSGAETTAAICVSIGLSPLILLCLGLLSRVNDSVGRNSKSAVSPILFRLLTSVTIVGLILCIVGINDSTPSTNKTSVSSYKVDAKTEVGVILFVLAWACLSLLLAVVAMHMSFVDSGEKRLVLAVAISVPFILVRLCYSLLGDFTHHNHFNPLTGSVTIYLCMAVFMEFAVVITCLAIGFTLQVIPRSALASPVGTVRQSQQAVEPDGSLDTISPNYLQSPRATDTRNIVPWMVTRKERGMRQMKGGPIHTLIGLAMDHHAKLSTVETQQRQS